MNGRSNNFKPARYVFRAILILADELNPYFALFWEGGEKHRAEDDALRIGAEGNRVKLRRGQSSERGQAHLGEIIMELVFGRVLIINARGFVCLDGELNPAGFR